MLIWTVRKTLLGIAVSKADKIIGAFISPMEYLEGDVDIRNFICKMTR